MKRKLFRILLLAISVVLLIGLTSCDIESLMSSIPGLGGNGTGNGEGGEGEGGENNGGNGTDNGGFDGFVENEGELTLIRNGVARFQIVYTVDAGGENVRGAQDLAKKFRELGIDVADPIQDTEKDSVMDYEIIIGPGARNRDEACSISTYDLGKDGYIIKTVGTRVVIAGGDKSRTATALSIFRKSVLKIDKATDFSNCVLKSEHTYIEQLTSYLLSKVTIAGVDLGDYTLVLDIGNLPEEFNTGIIDAFRQNLYNASGKYLDLGNVANMDSYEHKYIIRFVETLEDIGSKPGLSHMDGTHEDGFRAYIDGNDFIVECSYANAFEKTFMDFASRYYYDKMGEFNAQPNFKYTENVAVVNYKDFGANGKDTECDFEAIYNAHVYANQCGQLVKGDANATYYISAANFTKTVPVVTNVDWNGATFIIDDTGSVAYAYRALALFSMWKDDDNGVFYQKTEDIIADFGTDISLKEGDTSIPWLVPALKGESMIRIFNANHRDYIRHGANQNSGSVRSEVLIINPDGTLAENSPVRFDYETLTGLTIWTTDDAPISVGNGIFYNICCRTVTETDFVVKYHSYNRGLRIERSNVTIHDVKHQMLDEPVLNRTPWTYDESYPYNRGLLYINQCYNLLVKDCIITGHTTYYEPKKGTASSNDGGMNYVAAGSYDFVVEHSTDIYFDNMDQVNGRYSLKDGKIIEVEPAWDLADQSLWGIMSSNFAKNIHFNGCEVSRIDAHQGFWNVEVIDTIVGHTLHAIGGGDMYLENVTKRAGDKFLVTRGDYGGSFQGDVVIKNCQMLGYSAFTSNAGGSLDVNKFYGTYYVTDMGYYDRDDAGYWDWYFGYTCYMPTTITMEGSFKIPATAKMYMFREDYTAYYEYIEKNLDTIREKEPAYEPYQLTKQIIYKNWTQPQIPINNNADPAKSIMYKNIEIVIKNDEE